MMHTDRDPERYRFLTDAALAAGAVAAVIMPAGQIAVEERVRLKCSSGCSSYGKHLTCPPYSPTPQEFRHCLNEYSIVLLVKFRSAACLDDSIRCCLLSTVYDPGAAAEKKLKAARFFREFTEDNRNLNRVMLELENLAFNAGNPFALSTACGTCCLCENCDTKTRTCSHPTLRRFPAEALGINVVKTAADAGVHIRFPSPENPERVAFLLID